MIKNKQKKLQELEKGSEYIKELSDIALLQLELEQYKKSEQNLLTCLDYFKKQKDRLGQASVLGILGTLYYKKANYETSIENYKNALEIYRDLNQIQEQIMCLKGIGNAFIKQNNLEKASDLFFKCANICSDHKAIYDFLDCLGNLIFIFENKKEWDVVFELYIKSLKAFQKINDKKGIITSYFNLGIIKKSKEQKYSEALSYFKKGTNVAIDANYSELILKGLSYIGESLYYLGKIKEAKEQFIRGLHLAGKINAGNAIQQYKILLNSFGLNEQEIQKELENYRRKRADKRKS
ncbi:MAG: tetratricopeptide repeat protein [Candidatus Lokiarchaeota archaeon]|nr:tetratricopeptide repeat protein [Candidatus Lokiarchaeota archaeon]